MLMSRINFLWIELPDLFSFENAKNHPTILTLSYAVMRTSSLLRMQTGCSISKLGEPQWMNEWATSPSHTRLDAVHHGQIRLRQLPANLPQSLEPAMFAYKRHPALEFWQKKHPEKNKRMSVLWSLMSVINLVHFSGCCLPAMMQDLQQLLQLTEISRFWKLVH